MCIWCTCTWNRHHQTASVLAGASQLTAQAELPHRIAVNDYTGVLTDSSAQHLRDKERREKWLVGLSSREAVQAAMQQSQDRHHADGVSAEC